MKTWGYFPTTLRELLECSLRKTEWRNKWRDRKRLLITFEEIYRTGSEAI
jgi:hypothetical protein